MAIRGPTRQIKCDQGTNFKGANNELKAALKEMTIERITAFLADVQCEFAFNAPGASHAGGLWERQIQTVKRVLHSTISLAQGRLDAPSMRTLLYEAMTIVNNRPLSVKHLNDPEIEPLTPNNLLTMKERHPLPPPGSFVKEDLYLRKRWRRVQFLAEQFWSRWRREYLDSIAHRSKWLVPRRNVTCGDVVILKDDNLSRHEWPLGRVIETLKSRDGLVRRVRVQMASRELDAHGRRVSKVSILERPIQKIVVLLEAA